MFFAIQTTGSSHEVIFAGGRTPAMEAAVAADAGRTPEDGTVVVICERRGRIWQGNGTTARRAIDLAAAHKTALAAVEPDVKLKRARTAAAIAEAAMKEATAQADAANKALRGAQSAYGAAAEKLADTQEAAPKPAKKKTGKAK